MQFEDMIGRTVAGVRLTSLIGEGGMGFVMKGERLTDGKPAAVKFMRVTSGLTPELIERFEREASVLLGLDHPNLLRVHEFGRTDEGTYFITMEYVEGCSVKELLKRKGALECREAVEIALGAARGLRAAWTKKIIHRDIKPDNLLLTPEGTIKIADFGLAKNTTENRKLTLTGQVIGTPAFMSPEQGQGDPADHRSDIYSLGVTLYVLLTGRRPFTGSTPLEVVMKHIKEVPPSLRDLAPGLPEGVSTLVDSMMAKDREGRPVDVSIVVDALEGILEEFADAPSRLADVMREALRSEALDAEAPLEPEPDSPGVAPSPPEVAAEAVETPTPPTEDAMAGKVIAGKYEVKRRLGEGGMGSVYLVRHRSLNQDYALKILNPYLASDPAFRSRFMLEAKAASAFVHKNAVQIRDFGEDGALLFMTMDFCPGSTLQEVLSGKERLAEKRVASIAHQALGALREAHATGLVHRDLKPGNLMIEEREGRDFVRILDFGVAKMLVGGAPETSGPLTRSGAVLGTVQYMAPEQAMTGNADRRSDLYALAAIMYESLTGRLPVEGENQQQLLFNLATRNPAPLSTHVKGISRALERLVMRNLSKKPDDRCASAEEFQAELESCSRDLKSEVAIRRKGVPWPFKVGVVLMLVAACTAAIVAGLASRPGADPAPSTEENAPPARASDGPSPAEIRKTMEEELGAFETAMAERDHRAALGHALNFLKHCTDPEDLKKGEEIKKRAQDRLAREQQAWDRAREMDGRGEILKALPLYEDFLLEFPASGHADSAGRRTEEIRKELAEFRGVVVETTPPGADVFLDDVQQAKTPCLIRDVPPGPHTLLIDLAGHRPVTRDFEFSGREKVEIREELKSGRTGKIRIVSARGDALFVVFMGEKRGKLPVTLDGLEAGVQRVEIADETGVAYFRDFEVKEGQVVPLIVDFQTLIAEEEDAWKALPRGSTAPEALDIHRGFLSRFPKGRRAGECAGVVKAIEEEEKARRACDTGEPEQVLRACRAYLAACADLEYPRGWYVEEVRSLAEGIEKRMEEEAYVAVSGAGSLQERKTACEEYMKRFASGPRAAECRKILSELGVEERLLAEFHRERSFARRVEAARKYLGGFEDGFAAEEVRTALEELLEKERTAAEAVLREKDVDALLEKARAYSAEFAGGAGSQGVEEKAAAAEAEKRSFLECEDGAGNCRKYLERYPEGWYRGKAAALLESFGWSDADIKGRGFNRRLPPAVRRGDRPGEYVSRRDGAVLVWVPEGWCLQGSNDFRGEDCDMPEFKAWVSGFFIDKAEVTNEAYGRFLEAVKDGDEAFRHPDQPVGKSHVPDFWKDPRFNRPEQPVVGVDWFDAIAYARWAGRSLPTEAQWEKAASMDILAWKKSRFPWGDEPPRGECCNFNREREGPVDANLLRDGRCFFGALHMAGNASEWCLDCFDEALYGKIVDGFDEKRKWTLEPFCGSGSRMRAVRGGSWRDEEIGLVTSRRRGFEGRADDLGFRCALPVGKEKK